MIEFDMGRVEDILVHDYGAERQDAESAVQAAKGLFQSGLVEYDTADELAEAIYSDNAYWNREG